jgi:hypothetical protein
MIISSGAIVLGTPYLLVRTLNLILAIVISVFLGAFIRELVIKSNEFKKHSNK